MGRSLPHSFQRGTEAHKSDGVHWTNRTNGADGTNRTDEPPVVPEKYNPYFANGLPTTEEQTKDNTPYHKEEQHGSQNSRDLVETGDIAHRRQLHFDMTNSVNGIGMLLRQEPFPKERITHKDRIPLVLHPATPQDINTIGGKADVREHRIGSGRGRHITLQGACTPVQQHDSEEWQSPDRFLHEQEQFSAYPQVLFPPGVNTGGAAHCSQQCRQEYTLWYRQAYCPHGYGCPYAPARRTAEARHDGTSDCGSVAICTTQGEQYRQAQAYRISCAHHKKESLPQHYRFDLYVTRGVSRYVRGLEIRD